MHCRSQILSWEKTGTHLCTSDTKMFSSSHFQRLRSLCRDPAWVCSVNSAVPECNTSRSYSTYICLRGRLHWHSAICTFIWLKCLEWGSTFSDANKSTLNRTFEIDNRVYLYFPNCSFKHCGSPHTLFLHLCKELFLDTLKDNLLPGIKFPEMGWMISSVFTTAFKNNHCK